MSVLWALLMPVAIQAAARSGRSPALILMPLSFASILGGLTTLIGTPPNIIIASYRARERGESFAMFDFTPVGALTAIAGVLFVAAIGWRPDSQGPVETQKGPGSFRHRRLCRRSQGAEEFGMDRSDAARG